jgi:phosphoribosylformylglycinamidine synthase
VIRVPGTRKGLVAATDGNASVSSIDPWLGAAMSVAEAARNVAITGARPLGVTNCLNYGDPTRPDAFWQLAEGVRGLGDACRALGLPVTGGNVSLYNESPRGRIQPTPQIGVVGLLEDAATAVGPALRRAGDAILLAGQAGPGLEGSEYARVAGVAPEDRPPAIDLELERRLHAFLRDAAAQGLLASAQDVSAGGFAVALAEAAIWGSVGARVRLPVSSSPAVDLFGESPSRAILSAAEGDAEALERLAAAHAVPCQRIGVVGGDRLVVDLTGSGATGAAEERGSGVADAIDVALADGRRAWEQGLPRALGWEPAS